MDAATQFGDIHEVVGPKIVDHGQLDAASGQQHLTPQPVHFLAMIFNDGFVFPERLADFEILRFGGALHAFNVRIAGHAEAEKKYVFEADEEARGSRIALPPGAAAKLVIDPPGLMPRCADDIEAAEFRDPFSQHYVGAPARHVGRYRDRAEGARPRDDLRFGFVVPRVKD